MIGKNQQAADLALCRRILPEVSRTFALSIEALPGELRAPIRVAYLLCRLVDTVEDAAGVELPHRNELFDCFDRLMQDDAADPAVLERLARRYLAEAKVSERELSCNAGAVFRSFRGLDSVQREAIRPHVLEMSKGMREYVQRANGGGLQLTTMEDLEHYCFYVAGTVGNLLTELFLLWAPQPEPRRLELQQRAVGFGLGLQMVNVVKDVSADLKRGGHCFLPKAVVEERGITLSDLMEPKARVAALGAVSDVCARARLHLQRAQDYTELWPVPQGLAVRRFCAVPLALAFATLKEVASGAEALQWGKVPKVSRETVARVLRDTHRAVGSNRALGELFQSCQ